MKTLMLLLFTTLLSAGMHAQNMGFEWASGTGSTEWDESSAITTAISGNVYTTGYFAATVDFDPGVSEALLTAVGHDDIFIQKLDPAGNFLWARRIGGTGADRGIYITTDASGNVYATGWFEGTVDFDPGHETSVLSSAGDMDIYVLKLDASGNFLWARRMGSSNRDEGVSITTDSAGNVYTTGFFQGTVDFDPGGRTLNLVSASTQDIFIQKLDNMGQILWAVRLGGVLLDESFTTTADASGNVYTTGFFQGTVDFDPGSGFYNLVSSGVQDIFILKLDAMGNFLWVSQVGGAQRDEARSIVIDASGYVYTTGLFQGTADFDPAPVFSILCRLEQMTFLSRKWIHWEVLFGRQE